MSIGFGMVFLGSSTLGGDSVEMIKQPPGYQRMQLGDYVVTSLYDCYLDVGMDILQGAPQQEIRDLLIRGFMEPGKIRIEVNAFLIDTGTQKILVDTGSGNLFGPTAGKLSDNLAKAGFNTSDIDAVLITHMHGDHMGGLLDDKGNARYNNAVVYSALPEAEYWLSETEANKAPEEAKVYFKMASHMAEPYRTVGKWKTVENGQTLPAGIKARFIPGHTVGHTAYEVTSGGETLLIIGDLVHFMAAQLPRPEISVTWDADAQQAVSERLTLFKQAADQKIWVGAMHLPYPGIGKLITRETGGYGWLPVTYSQIQ